MDTTEAISREAPLATRHAWFLSLYTELLRAPAAARPAILERLAGADADDPVEAALALYLTALLAQATSDTALTGDPRALRFRDRIAARLEREMRPATNSDSETWLVALWAAAIREVNHLAPREDMSRLLSGVKNHVFAHHTRGGGLMSSSDRTTLDFDVLLAAVPFGLFDCEDLVLVDSVRALTTPDRLAEANDADRLLLAWYYAEQGSYAKSRALLADAGASPLQGVVRQRLKALGQLSERLIRHVPDGNGNRYEPLIEERFPKLVTENDDVIVRALAAPLSPDEPVELVIGRDVIAGHFTGSAWEFVLPPRPARSVVEYRLRFARDPDLAVGPFAYEVLARRNLGDIVAVDRDGERLTLQATRGTLAIASAPHGGLRFDIDPRDATAASDENPASCTVGGYECRIDPSGVAIISEGKLLFALADVQWLQSADGTVREISAALAHAPCGYFGFGERYNALDQAGQRVDQFVYNQYKEQGLRTYIPIPVAYTDAGFGLHLDTDSYSWFDLTASGVTRFGVEAAGLAIDVFSGRIAEQVAQFMAATGEPAPVPDWALGPWMSSNNWDSQAEVRKQVDLTQAHGIPATVLVIEAWSDEATFYIFNDAQYAGKPGSEAFRYADFTFPEWGRWPDPRALAEHLHDSGLKLILWQIPVIRQLPSLRHAQKERDQAYFLERGFGVKHPDGTALRLPEGWFKDSLLMDFTNPEGVAWWFAKRQYLVDELGVDGFKTDGGEMVWGRDLVFSDGTDGRVNRNRYPRDYISAYYRFAQQNGGICFSRSGYTGAQTFPAHWAGDERSTWDAFKRSILAGLSAGMSGIIFWGWDLGGFSGDVPSAELYIRSAQMACFCPIMQYHAESKAEFNQDRTPWNIAERSGDPRALTGYAFYANLRMSLLPYLKREAAHCVEARTPLMRAMILDHQDDQDAVALWDQYMLGRDLLVAPVIEEGATSRSVYLPEGRWWHLLQSRWFEGGLRIELEAPFEQIPVFLREGAVLPIAFDREMRLGAPMPSHIEAAGARVLLVAGEGTFEDLTFTRQGDGVSVTGHAHRPVTVAFTDPPAHVEFNGNRCVTGHVNLSGTSLRAVTLSKHPGADRFSTPDDTRCR